VGSNPASGTNTVCRSSSIGRATVFAQLDLKSRIGIVVSQPLKAEGVSGTAVRGLHWKGSEWEGRKADLRMPFGRVKGGWLPWNLRRLPVWDGTSFTTNRTRR